MIDYFNFEVGENEIHRVQYYDEYGGYLNVIMVDGEIISGMRFSTLEFFGGGTILPLLYSKYPNLKKGNEIKFKVGIKEVHDVKIVFNMIKELGISKGCDIDIYIDGKLFDIIEYRRKGVFD